MKSRSFCIYPVLNVLSSSLVSKNVKINIYITTIIPVVLYGCETWSLTLRDECNVEVFREYGADEDIWA